MSISREWFVSALLASVGVLSGTASAQAELLDFLHPPKVTASRGQTPDPAFTTGYAAQPVSNQSFATTYEANAAAAGWCFKCSPCFNCGEYDHYQRRIRHCRACCKSTWYPRVAPYCQPNWGWTQPCWRRTGDNYACVRPDSRGSMPKPRSRPKAAPEVEPALPEPPPLPTSSLPNTTFPTSSLPAVPPRAASQTASYSPPAVPRPERAVIERTPDPSRFTSVAETIESDMDDEEMEDSDLQDTLEAQVEADAADGDADEESDAPLMDE